MSQVLMRSGEDFTELFQFYLAGVAEDLSAATIKASVISLDKTSELITDTAQSNSGTGVSWVAGTVGLVFTAAQTASLTPQAAWIEVCVTKGGLKLPYANIPIVIEKGWTTS